MQPFSGRGRFYLLRHGATAWNLEHRLMGRRQIGLSPAGRLQIEGLLPHLGALGIEAIWSSPLRRARDSADIVSAAMGLPVHEEADLTEVDYGAWEGRTYREIVSDPAFLALERDPLGGAAPGGENLHAVRARVLAGMERIAARSGGRTVLVVSHGDPLRIVLAGCLRLPLEELRRLRLDTGALSGVELTGDWAEVKFVNLRAELADAVDSPLGSPDPGKA